MNKLLSINYSLYFGISLVFFTIFLAIFGPIMAPHTLTETLETSYVGDQILAPPLEPFESMDYPLGTDRWGYDLLSMVLYGIRYTLMVSVVVTIIKMLFGTIIGIYVGTWKKTPQWIEAIETAWSYIPLFLILFFFFNPISFGERVEPSSLIFYFITVTSIISIPSIISSVRKKTIEISQSIYIEAARVLGANRHRIIWKHIFPQMKESLLIMFILEIVYVITIMGQLALMNIFIGGTIVRYDPTIYLSITKELSGLVGSSRGNVYGSIYILYIPLFLLLLTTGSFSLLANGLKNRFQSNYQRTPWIKTGFEPKLIPKRKVLNISNKGWFPKGEKLALTVLLLVFTVAGSYVFITKDSDIGVKNGSKANYEIKLKMDENNEFQTSANIRVTNKSTDKWDELIFYFIPNAVIESLANKTEIGISPITIKEIKVNGEKVSYTLEHDTLKIKLKNIMENRSIVDVKISYQFTIPENGSRFTRVNNEFYLAQWYPMLATYQNGKWNKEDYQEGLETFHTDFSNYHIQYDLPNGYSFVSTSDKDPELNEPRGKVKINRVRDFFIVIVNDMEMHSTFINGVEVRLFTKTDHDKNAKDALELARKALGFYQEEIGKYPHKQLDIILAKGHNMEYPGIVTINPYHDNAQFYKVSIVHEIAHQYFYGVVANDPYHEAWIDEGMTEFATNMYFYLGENQGMYQSQAISNYRMKNINELGLGRQYSNVPLSENKHVGYIYGQPALNLFSLIKDKYRVRGQDFQTVITEYLSDYYEHFQYKEVNTSEFIRFTKDYFQVPKEYFNNWLDTSEINY
jgi:ABC-type dipeptide/oligopeptide/nickel transport system permease subunit